MSAGIHHRKSRSGIAPRNEYLAAENRVLRAKIKGRLQLSGGEKSTLGEIARRLGRKALAEVAVVAKPDTILRQSRRLVARKFDGSRFSDSRSGDRGPTKRSKI